MANPSTISLQLVAAVANGICLSQVPAGAGALTLNGSLVSSGVGKTDVARRIAVASNANDATVVFTVTGTNQSGAPISSTVTGLNASSAFTALDFATVTSVTSSAATVGNITVGTCGVASTPWIVDDFTRPFWGLRVGVSIASGAVTFTVEHTYDDPNDIPPTLVATPQQFAMNPSGYNPPLAWPDSTLANANANGETNFAAGPIFAHRLTITAGTGLAVMQSIQSGIGGF
jgi:hypothetical protein